MVNSLFGRPISIGQQIEMPSILRKEFGMRCGIQVCMRDSNLFYGGWRMICLPTLQRLHQINLSTEVMCPLCSFAEESAVHLFCECIVARSLWFGWRWTVNWGSTSFQDAKQFLLAILNPTVTVLGSPVAKEDFLLLAAVLMDLIWTTRNAFLFLID